jgi:hypothetical protein
MVLRWGAVVLPTALSVAGLVVAVETPKVEKTSTKWAIRIGLIVFGLVTSAFVFLQQDYDRAEAAKDQKAAINSFKSSQSEGFKRVETTIQAIPAPQITVQPAPVILPKTPEAAAQHAQMDTTSFEVGHTSGAPSTDMFTFNMYFQNNGQIHGDSPNRVTSARISATQLSPNDVDLAMSQVVAAAVKLGPPPYRKDRAQMAVGKPMWVSSFMTLPKEDAATFDTGRAWTYLLEVLTYRDPNTGRAYWVSEYCAARQPDGTINMCGNGNRTWLHK